MTRNERIEQAARLLLEIIRLEATEAATPWVTKMMAATEFVVALESMASELADTAIDLHRSRAHDEYVD